MEVWNSVDIIFFKEKYGVFFYSINGILGFKSGFDLMKD